MYSLTTGSHPHEAFLLITLSDATLTTPTSTLTGTLNLECVTVAVPYGGRPSSDRAVYLVLRLNHFETPVDPARVIHCSVSTSGLRTYTFDGTEEDPSDLVITFPQAKRDSLVEEDIETFEGILAQYADLRRSGPIAPTAPDTDRNRPATTAPTANTSAPSPPHNLRGQLVLVNEENGEVVGEVDSRVHIQEDPRLHERGRENDPVVIEVSDEKALEDLGASELFALAVPSEEQDWMTKSASMISHAISATTNLLLTTITSASTQYIAKSSPSVHHPGNANANPNAPPPVPPRTLVLLTSETTRKGLSGVHAVSGHAVNVSHKTVSLINSMIERAVGHKGKRGLHHFAGLPPPQGSSHRAPSPSPSAIPPPPYSTSLDKPGLPPRRAPSPSPTSSAPAFLPSSPGPPPKSASPLPPPLPPRRLRTRDRIILSADLILSTLDESAKQIVEVGGDQLSAVLGHKFGPAAAQTSLLATGTARNLVLVYIDMRGIGRKAILKRGGRKFVTARMSSRK